MDKDTEKVEVQAEAQPEVVAAVTEEVVEAVQDTPAVSGFDIQGILDNKEAIGAVSADVTEIKESLSVIAGALEVLAIAQKNTLERVESAEKAREEEVVALTPTYSQAFKSRIDSIIGQPAAAVTSKEGSNTPVFSSPEQAKPVANKEAFGSSFLSSLVEKGS